MLHINEVQQSLDSNLPFILRLQLIGIKTSAYDGRLHHLTESSFLNETFKLSDIMKEHMGGSQTYTHVFAVQSFHFLNHDILQNLVVKDLSQL